MEEVSRRTRNAVGEGAREGGRKAGDALELAPGLDKRLARHGAHRGRAELARDEVDADVSVQVVDPERLKVGRDRLDRDVVRVGVCAWPGGGGGAWRVRTRWRGTQAEGESPGRRASERARNAREGDKGQGQRGRRGRPKNAPLNSSKTAPSRFSLFSRSALPLLPPSPRPAALAWAAASPKKSSTARLTFHFADLSRRRASVGLWGGGGQRRGEGSAWEGEGGAGRAGSSSSGLSALPLWLEAACSERPTP